MGGAINTTSSFLQYLYCRRTFLFKNADKFGAKLAPCCAKIGGGGKESGRRDLKGHPSQPHGRIVAVGGGLRQRSHDGYVESSRSEILYLRILVAGKHQHLSVGRAHILHADRLRNDPWSHQLKDLRREV